MTVSSTTVKNSYSGNGSNDTFVYGFKIFANTDIQVIIRSSTGTETTKTITTHYTVTGVGDASGGNVVFTTGNIPTASETVVLIRNVPQTQAIDYIANDPFPAETHEEGLDRATMTTQQVQEELDRSIKLSRTNTMTSTEFTVGATDRANKVLSFDSTGELSVTQELGTFKGNWSSGTAYVVRDIVKDTSTNNIFIVNTAHTASGSQPLTTNANSAKYDLIVDAASATTSATAAATSATAAASSATAAASSATTASTQASNASTSASTASTQATNAANSATASASSATSAANSLDTFDDTYLGAKSSDPTADNDGDALAAGMLYTNTSTGNLKFYNGSAWVNVSTGLTSIAADTTPQLGGNLDTNEKEIVTLSNRDLLLAPNGTGVVEIKGNTNGGTIQLNCENNSHGVKIQSPAHSAGQSYTLILPTSVGSANQVLASNGSSTNQLSWIDAAETKPTVADVSQTIAPATATTINITGTGFVAIPIVDFINASTGATTRANTVSLTSATQLSVNLTIASGNYFVRIENPDGNSGRSTNNIITASTAPSFSTAAGSLGTIAAGSSVSLSVAASSDSNVTIAETTSVLTSNSNTPAGTMNLTLAGTPATSATYNITGTAPSPTGEQTYNFTLSATDVEGQAVTRDFSITISVGINNSGQFN
jgi:hypothetical protein